MVRPERLLGAAHLAPADRVGGGRAPAALPHHRTCGSAYCGSRKRLEVILGGSVNNGEERLVVLNRIAKSVVGSLRGLHAVNVFARVPGKGANARPLSKIYNTAWKSCVKLPTLARG